MTAQYFSLGDAARVLGIPPYQISYLLSTGKVPEPKRIGNRRLFSIDDLAQISEYIKLAQVKEDDGRH